MFTDSGKLSQAAPVAPWRACYFVWLLLLGSFCSCREVGSGFTRPKVGGGRGRLEVRSLLTDASTTPGLCASIIIGAGYPCEEITVLIFAPETSQELFNGDNYSFGRFETAKLRFTV